MTNGASQIAPAKEPERPQWPEYFSFYHRELEFEAALQDLISQLMRQARWRSLHDRQVSDSMSETALG